MKKTFLIIAAALLLSGCSAPELNDGYQFGDITHLAEHEQTEIKQAVKDYCDRNQDSAIRYAALNLIRLKFPFVPENGICG